MLEPRRLLSASAEVDAPAAIVGRYVFYNDSRFDGHDREADADDDRAIAPDKQALLPGQKASYVNYTSYSAGINGIMIDIAGLSGVPTASDFVFHVGTGGETGDWTLAPAPEGVNVRHGGGVGRSSRVTITWGDNAIENAWLKVDVLPTANTGLAQADEFFFGNLIGFSGTRLGDPTVSFVDAQVTAGKSFHRARPAPLIVPFDYNRDGLVDSIDESIARNGRGNSLLQIAPLAEAAFAALPQEALPSEPQAAETAWPWPAEAAYTDFVLAEVVARHVFHNNSPADGFDPAANANDDLAIEDGISTLLPGAKASSANYVHRYAGINGLMIDMLGLPDTPTLDDFGFLMGNSDDPGTWVAAPAPAEVTVRAGAGVDGASRITFVWPDDALKDTWLQVTVRATPRTGLPAADVFYLGHTTLTGGPLRSPFRSRDERFDQLAPLRMITTPSQVVEPQPVRQQPELFAPGDANYAVSFAPALSRAVDGTLLAFAQGRWGFDDQMSQAIVMRRSTDNGVSWSATETIFSVPPSSPDIVGPPAPIVDEITGEIFMLITVFTPGDSFAYVIGSTDHGLTWSQPEDVTSDVKVTAEGNPNPAAFPNDPWGWIAIGPGHGIQINNGPYAGRLIIGGDHRLTFDTNDPSWSHVIYSDDHGQTWQLGGGLDQTDPANDHSNEATLVETDDGSLYMGIRVNEGNSNYQIRGYSRSDDGGATWDTLSYAYELTTFPVHGSLLRVNEDTIIFSAPDSVNGVRQKMTIWVSQDDGASWSKGKAVTFDYAGYSDMVLVGPDTVLIAYNGGHTDGFSADYISLARFNLNWLLGEEPEQFIWHFNEQEPGTTADILGTTIVDAGGWDIRSGARADSQSEAPLYVAGAQAGDSALALTEGSDHVVLTPAQTRALQFDNLQDFTIELTMRTTDSDGVIIGTLPVGANWRLLVEDGHVKLIIWAASNVRSSITSADPINDGQWHRIAVVRDGFFGTLAMYIDGVLSASAYGHTQSVRNTRPVTLGAYNDATQQLAFDIDTLRVTRALVDADDFLPASYVAPPRFVAAPLPADAPNTIAGLEFWLTSYEPTRFHSGLVHSDPLPLEPVSTTATQSAYDASGNSFELAVSNENREVLYAYDPAVGANWHHGAAGATLGNQWIVQNPNSGGASNFDFVQNTGVFTLSAFIKPGTTTGTYMSLLDTSRASSTYSGFNLSVAADGSLGMTISGPDGTLRLNQGSPAGLIATDQWHHVAVVGSGPGQPVTFYVTPATASTVAAYQSAGVIAGANGTYPSSADNPLTIGALAGSGSSAYNGYMVDQAIFDRPLTEEEIQLLFDFTKKI